VFVGLHQRAIEANVWGADIFVSFHVNGVLAQTATGSETWFYHEHSRELAEKLQQALAATLGLANRGVKQKGFVVVKKPQMPAALMEPFFISNRGDLNRYLERREQLQVNIAKTILDYVGVVKKIEAPSGRGRVIMQQDSKNGGSEKVVTVGGVKANDRLEILNMEPHDITVRVEYHLGDRTQRAPDGANPEGHQILQHGQIEIEPVKESGKAGFDGWFRIQGQRAPQDFIVTHRQG